MTSEDQLKRLRFLMKQRIDGGDFSVTEMAKLVGLSQSTISNFVNGRRGAKRSTVDLYKSSLGISDQDIQGFASVSPQQKTETVPVVRHVTAINASFISSNLVLRDSGLTIASLRNFQCKPTMDRENWTRFVAVVSSRSQARFLEPIFKEDALLFIDRHDQRRNVEANAHLELYAVNNGGFLGIGYLEPMGKDLLVKSNNPGRRSMLVRVDPKHSVSSVIVGRVFHVSTDVGTRL